MKTAGTQKILFISHEASRTGAPIVLLNLIKWIKENTDQQFDILLLNDGPLRPEFELLGETFVATKITGEFTFAGTVKKKVFGWSKNDYRKKCASYFSAKGYSLIYGNTILSLPLLEIFKQAFGIKTICCVHELSFALNYLFTKQYLEENLKRMDLVIAVSNAVKQNLIGEYNLSEKQVALFFEFIETSNEARTDQKISKDELGISPGEFIIGAGGTPEWRKGTDLLIPLTVALTNNFPDLKFKIVWLGGYPENTFFKQLRYDAQKCGIEEKIILLENKDNPLDYINLFDVFVLLSREDPFPLIVLEAALLKKPIIAFEKAGGIPELIEQGAGLLAGYLDITAVAGLIYKLSADTELTKKLGDRGNQLVTTKFSVNVVPDLIYQEILKIQSF